MASLQDEEIFTLLSANSRNFIYDRIQHRSDNCCCSERVARSVDCERTGLLAGDMDRVGIMVVMGIAGIDAITISAGGSNNTSIAATRQ
jgi:hypothetical protein